MFALLCALIGLCGFILLLGFTVFGMTVEEWPFESWKPSELMRGVFALFCFGSVSILLLAVMFLPMLILLHLNIPYAMSAGVGLPLGFLSMLIGGHFLLERASRSQNPRPPSPPSPPSEIPQASEQNRQED